MARITIEDCMEQVPNRFQLVQMAAIRAKQLKKGARPLVSAEDNKAVVTSLREIAEGLVRPGDAEPEERAAAPIAETPAAASAPAPSVASPEGSESPGGGESGAIS